MASRSEPLRAWRVADSRHPLFDGTGALLHGARWNSPGRRIVYAAETYAGALLETLVHASGRIPHRQAYIEILIPADVRVEIVSPHHVQGWDAGDLEASRRFGDRWYDERRSAVLLVPSVVTRVERNVLIHQEHPDFARIRASQPRPVLWDDRLWSVKT
jgi:RES domain-containing protein